MQKRNNSSEYERANWDWSPIQCTLRVNENGKKTAHWQLAPSILFTNPLSNESDPNVRLFVDTQKSLTYSPELGWNWHKSWNLPNISIRLQIKDEVTGEQLLSPKNVYAQIFAVKKNGESDRSQKLILQDVGIKGDSKMEMVDGQVYFSAIKFLSTTYNNEGQNFHLLIVVYIQQNQSEKPKVLTAVISPEIFVDSRRSARDYQEKKFNSFVEPFGLDQLDKQFIKRESKNRTDQQISIKNDAQGVYNYLTAPNIRHKVKHPIFLAIRFSECVSLFYNLDKFREQTPEQKMVDSFILENLQVRLMKESQIKNKDNIKAVISEKHFVIVVRNIQDSLKRKKVLESIQSLESDSIGVIYDEKEVYDSFKKLPQNQRITLTNLYRECYENLREICRNYVPLDAGCSDGESWDENAVRQEEPNRKNLKISKTENGNGFTFSSQGRKAKSGNIICKTIGIPDQIKANDQKINEDPDNSEENNAVVLKQVKKEQVEDQIIEQASENPAMNIKSHQNITTAKNGSAFNNLRPGMSIPCSKNENAQRPITPEISHSKFQNNVEPGYNQAVLNQLGGINPYGLGLGNANLNSLLGLGGLSGLNSLNALGGLGGLGNLRGLSHQQNNNELNQPSQQNPQGMNALQNLGLLGLSNLGMGGLGGFPGYNMNLNQLLGQQTQQLLGQQNQQQQQNNLAQLLGQQTQNSQIDPMYNLGLSNWINGGALKGNLQNRMGQQGVNNTHEDKQHLPNQDLSLGMNQQVQDQSIPFLMQQINLYRELLNQISYQNSLLQRNGMNPIQSNQKDESDDKRKRNDGNN